ncbi:MAG: hypothetical protein ACC657_12490 [Thiohalomonadales bacterium]
MEHNKNSIKDKLLTGAAVLVGFIGDILEPLAPFALYMFIFFSIVFLLVGISYWLLKKHRTKLHPILTQSLIVSITTGLIFSMQSFSESDNGVLAVYIPGIEKMQSTLGLIEKDIAAIKIDTTIIKQTTKEISSKIDVLGDKLGKQGGIIANPQIPEEWYHNARIYEVNGDFGNARLAYSKHFLSNGRYIDPHLRFQTFLKIQEGRAGASELYNEMFSSPDSQKNSVITYAKLLLKNSGSKRNLIPIYLKDHPDFAPAYYELSRLYSKNIIGEQTLEDKKNEKENLDKFLALNKNGKFIRYFIDKNEASKWIEDATSRYAAVNTVNKEIFVNPITVNAMHTSGAGWSLVVNVAEKAHEVYYRRKDQSEFTSLGFRAFLDPLTKKPYPNTVLAAPDLMGKQKIEFKYRDNQGKIKGPFDYMFYPLKELANYNAGLIKQMTNSWVSFRQFNGLRVDFGTLMTWRCGIDTVKYGVDKMSPDTVFKMPECNTINQYATPNGTLSYFIAPQKTKMISVQIDYANGDKSNIVKFNVPAS